MPLTLTRKEGQRLLIRTPEGVDIWVRVSHVYPSHRVALSVEAPENVWVLREELVQQGNTEAGR